MPYKTEKISLNDAFLKRSSKLLPCQREMIVFWGNRGLSQRKIANMFHVSRRLVIFILCPDKAKRNYQARVDNGGSTIYYNREQHNECVKNLRRYKQKLFGEKK